MPLPDLPEDNGLFLAGEVTDADMDTFLQTFIQESTEDTLATSYREAGKVFDTYIAFRAREEAMRRLCNLYSYTGNPWECDVRDESTGEYINITVTLRPAILSPDEVERYAKWFNLARTIPGTQLEFDFVWLELKGAGKGPTWVNVLGDVIDE